MNQLANCLGVSSMFLRYAFILVHGACVSNENSKCGLERSTLWGMFTNTLQDTLCVCVSTFNLKHTLPRPAYVWLGLCLQSAWAPLTPPHAPIFVFLEADLSREAEDVQPPIPVVLK